MANLQSAGARRALRYPMRCGTTILKSHNLISPVSSATKRSLEAGIPRREDKEDAMQDIAHLYLAIGYTLLAVDALWPIKPV